MRPRECASLVLATLALACGKSVPRVDEAGGAAGKGGSGTTAGSGSGGSVSDGAGGSADLGAGGSAKAGTGGSSDLGTGGSTDAGAAGSPEAGAAGSLGAGAAGAPSAGTGGSSNEAGGASDLGEGGSDVLPPLDVHAPDSAAVCDPAVCHVVQDAEALETDVPGVDFSVATSADTTYLVLASEDGSDFRNRLVALGAGQQAFARHQRLAYGLTYLAVDAAGMPHVAGTVNVIDNDNATIEETAWDGKSWRDSVVGSETLYGRTFALEIGQQDVPTVFWRDENGAYLVSTEVAGDTWHDTAFFGEASDYALDAQGRPTLFMANGSNYGAFDVDGNALVQVQLSDQAPGVGVPLRSAPAIPQALPSDAADMAMAALTTDGLHVLLASPGAAPVTDVPIPDTVMAATCPLQVTPQSGAAPGDTCAPTCKLHAVGLDGAFALARTADGASWLSYVTEDIDGQADYGLQCTQDAFSCINRTCWSKGFTGPATWTLHVVRVAPDGASRTEAMNVPIPGGPQAHPSVLSRAFAERVAVAVGIETAPPAGGDLPEAAGVRIITFEAAN